MKKKTLFEILINRSEVEIFGKDQMIAGLTQDSREVQPGFLFAALKGFSIDGFDFIHQSIEKGAKVILCERLPEVQVDDVTYLVAKNGRKLLGCLASAFYDSPSEKVNLIGITGTNGKTTVATLCYQLFAKLGYKVGLISTVENRIGDKVLKATHTTPEVVKFHSLLSEMADECCDFVFMEVSSHAVDQDRIAGAKFRAGIFTNMSHDHLDYHKTYLNYINAKKKFFDELDKDAIVITNIDDKQGSVMVQNCKSTIKTYGLKTMADYKTKILENNAFGLHMLINNQEAFFKMSGEFNAYNLTAVYGLASEFEIESEKIITILSDLGGAEGRFEKIFNPQSKTLGIVDYAHTPDALENVLATIKDVKNLGAEIITVVGCGGDRDKAKRPKMARIAVEMSDKVIFTSDNPRSEEPDAILADMVNGLSGDEKNEVLTIEDRKMAIKTAVMISRPGDVILVAGKGHEKTQEIKGEKFPFDDKKILAEWLFKI